MNGNHELRSPTHLVDPEADDGPEYTYESDDALDDIREQLEDIYYRGAS